MTSLRLADDALEWREVDGEVIALERRRAAYLGVNRTGTLLWHALEAGAESHELAELLTESYGIDAETAHADVARFVAQLREQGLLAQG